MTTWFRTIVYDLIELIIEASLWPMDYFSFDTHTLHTRLCSDNAYLICVIVHVQMWCVFSSTCWSNPKRFLSILYVFWKWFYTFMFLVFIQNAFLCFFFFKNWFRGPFLRSLRLIASRKMCLKEIKRSYFHTESLATTLRVFCD